MHDIRTVNCSAGLQRKPERVVDAWRLQFAVVLGMVVVDHHGLDEPALVVSCRAVVDFFTSQGIKRVNGSNELGVKVVQPGWQSKTIPTAGYWCGCFDAHLSSFEYAGQCLRLSRHTVERLLP